MRGSTGLVATGLIVASLFGPAADAADAGARHSRHHRDYRHFVEAEPPLAPLGYAYGGYGNGPGPAWSDGSYGPPGYGPGYGYIPPGYPDAGFDLGR